LSFADVPPGKMSRATTLTSVAQQLSLSVGISIGAITLETTQRLNGGVIDASSFSPAFLVVGLLTLASVVPFMRLAPNAGDEMSGRRLAPDPVTVMRERG
jgi:hypothetical protein